jgi:formate-dependent nitrite reductase membrane component NrfD
VGFLGVELVLLALLLLGLVTAGASQIAAAQILLTGAYAPAFWGAIVFAGIVLPIALQLAELGHRIPHTVVPALLVLAGGFALRWVLVNAGQASQVLQSASR